MESHPLRLIKRLRSLESAELNFPLFELLVSFSEDWPELVLQLHIFYAVQKALAKNPDLLEVEKELIEDWVVEKTKRQLDKERQAINRLISEGDEQTTLYNGFKPIIDSLIRLGQEGAIQKAQAKDPYFPEEEKEISDAIRFKARRRLGKQTSNELFRLFLYTKKEYSRSPWQLPLWLTRSRVWRSWSRRKKEAFKKVYSYLVELVRECPPWKEETKLLIQRAGGQYEEDVKDAVFIINWGKVSEDLEMSEHQLRRWILAFVGAGILKILSQRLERGRIVYSIGEFKSHHGGWPRLILYLKESETIIEEGKRKIKQTEILKKLDEMELPEY